jgi:methanethiol S-methyltransferase
VTHPFYNSGAVALTFAWAGAAAFVASLLFFLYQYLVTFGRPAPDGPWLSAAIADVLLFSAFALHHSVLARTPMRDAVRRLASPAMERTLYIWAASILFFVVCYGWQPVPGVAYALPAPWRWLGFGVQAIGVVLTYLGSRALDVLDLAGVRQVIVTEDREPEHAPLKTDGVYALVRHPIYFGWVLLVFGAPTMTGSRLVFALVSTAYLAIAVPWEERSLVEVFGHAYEGYRARVRWRMIPGIY